MRILIAFWLAVWFIIDSQVGYLITAPAILALCALTYARREKQK